MASTFTWRRSGTAIVALIALVGVTACGSGAEPNSLPEGSEPSVPPPVDTGAGPTPPSDSEPAPSPTPPSDDVGSTVAPDATPATVLADGLRPLGPTTQRLVDIAVADLAVRLDPTAVSVGGPIVVATVEEVTWRDGALGCPTKGMQYTQALVPGIRIVLEHDGTAYAYHAGNGDPFYCARPESPAPNN